MLSARNTSACARNCRGHFGSQPDQGGIEAGLEAAVNVVDGNPAEGVRRAVIECEGDLLVVGRGTSQKTVGRFWSNLYAIIRESPCPVLSV